jgi:2'-5' RNA ligase
MHGIVSLLDDQHYQLVENLWAELKREFAVEGVYVTPYPHFSYQIASNYNVEQLEDILHNFASHHTPLQVQTAGLGIFTGPQPVLYIPVVRSPELTKFHQALIEKVSSTGNGIQAYYQPDQWMPHITIGFGDLNNHNLSQIIGYLAERNFHWQITINNLAFIHDNGTRQALKVCYELSSGSSPLAC